MPTVLFVCTANICRSPMAAALFGSQLAKRDETLPPGEWLVRSAGTWAKEGLAAASGGAEVMAARGLDLAAHRSHQVTETDLRSADLVLVMTSGHREGLAAEFPFAAGRTHLLSRMVGRSYDIADPFGGPTSEYEVCARELESLIEAGFDRIVALAQSQSDSRD